MPYDLKSSYELKISVCHREISYKLCLAKYKINAHDVRTAIPTSETIPIIIPPKRSEHQKQKL